MRPSFLQEYLKAFGTIPGWFHFDAALMFMAYNQLINRLGIRGHTLEIGVHHGLSAIAIAALRGPESRFYAVDLFEKLQHENVSASGQGDRTAFEQNLRAFYPDLQFLHVLARSSRGLSPGDFPGGFSFCHIDGGHSQEETYNDLRLCQSILAPGGLLALDDYFNPEYPGVCEGAVRFALEQPSALAPVAIGFSKVLFRKLPAADDLNTAFRQEFPAVQLKAVTMWEGPAVLFPAEIRSSIDLYASTPERFVQMGRGPVRAAIALQRREISAAPGETAILSVALTNNSGESFPAGKEVLGLSYHLLSEAGELLRHDNQRTWITTPISPGEMRTVDVQIQSPSASGRYLLEVDLVWEQVMWFKDIGNPTAFATLTVTK